MKIVSPPKLTSALIAETVTAATLSHVWVQCRPLVDSALAHAHGELNSEQLRRLVKEGHMKLVVAHDREVVHAVLALEDITYPGYTALRVVVFAGRTRGVLKECLTRFWPKILAGAKANGCTQIESMCHPAMAKLLLRHGFQQRYVVVGANI